MTISRSLPQAEWKAFFEVMSDALLGKWAEVEVASLDLGDQIVAEWIPLLGITYDSRDDLVDVSLAGLNHLIRQPMQIEVTEGTDGLRTVAVTSKDGSVQVLRMKDPLRLPASTVQ